MLNLVKPKYFMPMHGELRQLKRHAWLAEQIGIPSENIIVVENGQVLELQNGVVSLGERIPGGYVVVEGGSIGEADPDVMREHEQLARSGIFLVNLSIDKYTNRLTGDPDYNVMLGTHHLSELMNEWGGNAILVAAAYNAGSGNVRRWVAANGDPRMPGVDPIAWIEDIPFAETRNYVQRVIENAVVYDMLDPNSRGGPRGRISAFIGRRRRGHHPQAGAPTPFVTCDRAGGLLRRGFLIFRRALDQQVVGDDADDGLHVPPATPELLCKDDT